MSLPALRLSPKHGGGQVPPADSWVPPTAWLASWGRQAPSASDALTPSQARSSGMGCGLPGARAAGREADLLTEQEEDTKMEPRRELQNMGRLMSEVNQNGPTQQGLCFLSEPSLPKRIHLSILSDHLLRKAPAGCEAEQTGAGPPCPGRSADHRENQDAWNHQEEPSQEMIPAEDAILPAWGAAVGGSENSEGHWGGQVILDLGLRVE